MDVMDPTSSSVLFPHSGTFSANPVSMVAGLTAMKLYDHAAIERLNDMGRRLRTGLEEAIMAAGIQACVTGGGSMFRLHFRASPPTDYRSSYMSPTEQALMKQILDYLYDHGIVMIGTGSGTLSTPMTDVEIDILVETLFAALREVVTRNGETPVGEEPNDRSVSV